MAAMSPAHRPTRPPVLLPAVVGGLALLALTLVPGASPAGAQPPHAEWRTLELPHFRVHYPAASEAWARRAAARLEAVRERLREEIGYAPPQVVDVIVSDPLSRPNGSAWPFLGNPRMVLWTTPPAPSSILGHYRDWGELVALHEDVHLVHLLRPSRNPWQDRLGRLIPIGGLGPIARRAPRWVTEGYATLLEGRLTGAGRPHGDLRAAVLRQRARAGRLPGYGALGAGDESWLGGSMAYLAGSAYLEWLEERSGPDALRDLWARMSARHGRSFEEAFGGVFGAGPGELYGRFASELTWRAMEAERRLGGEEGAVGGELWADLEHGTGTPAVAPDGSRIAAVVAHREEPPRLTVWETAVDEAAEERHRQERERIAREDPEDVPAVRTAPPARKVVATLPTFDGRAPADPRWSPDGESLLFWALGRGTDGTERADLYRWRVAGGGVERLTAGADLRYPDVLPAGERAVAVRSRHGTSQLVVVELSSGEVSELTEPSAEIVWTTPRLDRGGGRIAAVAHREGRWRLVVAELAAGGAEGRGELALGTPREIPTPDGATVADPAWGSDGTLYAAVGGGGFVEISAYDPRSLGERRLTRTLGAALAPAPTPDGEALFFLSLEHDGLDLRRMELAAAGAAEPAGRGGPPAPREPLVSDLVPAVAPPSPLPRPFGAADLPEARPYGTGPLEATPLLGLAVTSGGQAVEAGVAVSDVVGRLDGFVLGSLGRDGAIEGGALAAVWRGLPVELSGHLFGVAEEPSAQDGARAAGAAPERLDRDRFGLYAAGRWHRDFAAGALLARFGLHGERVEPERSGSVGSPASVDAAGATLSTAAFWAPSRGRRSLPMELGLRLQEGATDSERWRRWSARASAGLDLGDHALRLGYARRGSEDIRFAFDRFRVGGVTGSLLPDDVDLGRVEAPALPAGVLVGDEHESQRVDLELGFLPLPLFYERHRVGSEGAAGGKSGWLSLAGAEIAGALAPMPLLGLPAARWSAGAAYVLEDPVPSVEGLENLQDEVRFWATLTWRP